MPFIVYCSVMAFLKLMRIRFIGFRESKDIYSRYGMRGIFVQQINQTKLWRFKKNIRGGNSIASSISDASEYIHVCREAVRSNRVYNHYRFNFDYRVILDHVTREQGEQYLKFIEGDKLLISNLQIVSKNFKGGGFKYPYDGLGWISPTQIRYSKIIKDLIYFFGNLENFKIVEIGVGYGGQAVQILNFFNNVRYSIIDLPEVTKLVSKHLDEFGLSERVDVIQSTQSSDKPLIADLVISNYAFSELNREYQEQYFLNYISNSKRGYVIYNQIHENFKDTLSPFDFAERIQGAEIFAEEPLTHPGNVLVVWGHKND